MNAKEQREFEQYLRQCTDDQVLGVAEKELKANRRDYLKLAYAEMRRRGLGG